MNMLKIAYGWMESISEWNENKQMQNFGQINKFQRKPTFSSDPLAIGYHTYILNCLLMHLDH